MQMAPLDSLDHLVPMGLQVTEELLVCLDQQALWGLVELKALKESVETQVYKAKKAHRDLLDFKALLDQWVQEEKEVRKEVLASLVHQDWEGDRETRVHQDLLVIWVLLERQDYQDHQERLDHPDQLESEVSVVQ